MNELADGVEGLLLEVLETRDYFFYAGVSLLFIGSLMNVWGSRGRE